MITIETTLIEKDNKTFCNIDTTDSQILIKMNNVKDTSEYGKNRPIKDSLTLSLDYIIQEFIERHPDLELLKSGKNMIAKWFYKYIRKSKIHHVCLICCEKMPIGEPYIKRINNEFVLSTGKPVFKNMCELCTKCCNKNVLATAIKHAPDWIEVVLLKKEK